MIHSLLTAEITKDTGINYSLSDKEATLFDPLPIPKSTISWHELAALEA
jgi:hypothetical protein